MYHILNNAFSNSQFNGSYKNGNSLVNNNKENEFYKLIDTLASQQSQPINININIEKMSGSEDDVDKLIKMISDRIEMKKKRW